MKLKQIDNHFYLLSNIKFNQKIEAGTEYYDGKGNIRIWNTGNCFSLDSINILASTEAMGERPMINAEVIKTIIEVRDMSNNLNNWLANDIHEEDGVDINKKDLRSGFLAGFRKKSSIDEDKIFTIDELKEAMRIMIIIGMEIGREPSYNDKRISETIISVIKNSFPEKTEWEVDVLVILQELNINTECFVTNMSEGDGLKTNNGFVSIINKN